MLDSAAARPAARASVTALTIRMRRPNLMMFSRVGPCSRSRARMERAVDFTEITPVEMGVDGGGGDRRVTQQLLDHAQVGPALQQMRGERMPQRVRVDPHRQPRGAGVAAQDLPEPYAAERPTARVDEH